MASGNKPYVHINDRLRHYPALKAQLGGGAKFDLLNNHLGNVMVTPGELIVVGDESTLKVSTKESELMRLAFGVHYELLQNHATGDGQFIKNYDVLQNILNYGSLGIGASTGGWSKHLDGVQNTLENIDRHYQLMLKRGTPIARQEFINQRRALFAKLDTQLKGIARWGTGLHNQGSIKKMLGLSTKSYLHTRELRGYAERIGQIAKASKFLKHGTAVGIGLNTTAAALEIREACSTGREDTCTKAKYVEGAKLVGSVALGYIAGSLGAGAGGATCAVVFGVPCAIVFGAIAAYGGGTGGEIVGEDIGEVLYEWRP
jgi:hypothetical protein